MGKVGGDSLNPNEVTSAHNMSVLYSHRCYYFFLFFFIILWVKRELFGASSVACKSPLVVI